MASYKAICTECGHEDVIERKELDRAHQSHCVKCGSALQLSASARVIIAGAHDLRQREDSRAFTGNVGPMAKAIDDERDWDSLRLSLEQFEPRKNKVSSRALWAALSDIGNDCVDPAKISLDAVARLIQLGFVQQVDGKVALTHYGQSSLAKRETGEGFIPELDGN